MKLTIDGIVTDVQCGESLLDIVRRLGLDSTDLKVRPLAANIAGETFTLNYVPLREKEFVDSSQRVTLRRAMRAANGIVTLLRYNSARGNRVYERTMLFVFLLTMRKLYPKTRVRVTYAVGSGLYATIDDGTKLDEADIAHIKATMSDVVAANLTLERKRLDIDEAIDFFSADGQEDKVRLLNYRQFSYFDVYRQDDYVDYFYGEMAPSTGYVSVFDLQAHKGGLLLLRPSTSDPNVPAAHVTLPRLSGVFFESEEWAKLMHCAVVADLNDMVLSGKVRTLIRVNEALHEKRFAQLADDIVERGARAILIAGPSSSGKTTSANRLCTQLRVHGKTPILVSLDNYYLNRDKLLPGPDGTIDLEDIATIDVKQFKEDLARLLNGEAVDLPVYDFVRQKRSASGKHVQMDESTQLVIEGIHGLNPQLLPDTVDRRLVFRLYVSSLTTLSLDDHNRVPTTYLRLLRRMVRDYETRGASIEKTLSMWDSVRAGEEKWIFPYQEDADAIFNSTLIYEPAVLKKHIFPLLSAVQPESRYYDEARSIVKFLNYFVEANVEDEIPPTSLLREFIGGNTFYR